MVVKFKSLDVLLQFIYNLILLNRFLLSFFNLALKLLLLQNKLLFLNLQYLNKFIFVLDILLQFTLLLLDKNRTPSGLIFILIQLTFKCVYLVLIVLHILLVLLLFVTQIRLACPQLIAQRVYFLLQVLYLRLVLVDIADELVFLLLDFRCLLSQSGNVLLQPLVFLCLFFVPVLELPYLIGCLKLQTVELLFQL